MICGVPDEKLWSLKTQQLRAAFLNERFVAGFFEFAIKQTDLALLVELCFENLFDSAMSDIPK